jgi:hypothetical protein
MFIKWFWSVNFKLFQLNCEQNFINCKFKMEIFVNLCLNMCEFDFVRFSSFLLENWVVQLRVLNCMINWNFLMILKYFDVWICDFMILDSEVTKSSNLRSQFYEKFMKFNENSIGNFPLQFSWRRKLGYSRLFLENFKF